MKSPYDIIKKPVLTEKSYDQMAEKCYTFEVTCTRIRRRSARRSRPCLA